MVSDDFSFSKFSSNDFYSTLNARLVDMVGVGSEQRIVDLACGTGGVTQLILDRLRGARDSAIIAIDQSASALKQAMDELIGARDAAVDFVQSRVEQVSETVKESADTVFFCNAIHYIPDKDALVAEISKTLKPGGKFAFNTSFFEGGQLPETLGFYRKWMFKSARNLRRAYGLSLVRTEKVEPSKQPTPDQCRELVDGPGLRLAPAAVPARRAERRGRYDLAPEPARLRRSPASSPSPAQAVRKSDRC